MKEEIITFETAKLAKDSGFQIPCKSKFVVLKTKIVEKTNSTHNANSKKDNVYARPTQTLLQKWLREKHNIYAKTHPVYKNGKVMYEFIIFLLNKRLGEYGFKNLMSINIEPYYWEMDEEALEKALQEGLKLIKTNDGL